MAWLTPIVHIPSRTLGEDAGLVPIQSFYDPSVTFISLAIQSPPIKTFYWYRCSRGQYLPIFLNVYSRNIQYSTQVVRDVIANYKAFVNLLRIHPFFNVSIVTLNNPTHAPFVSTNS